LPRPLHSLRCLRVWVFSYRPARLSPLASLVLLHRSHHAVILSRHTVILSVAKDHGMHPTSSTIGLQRMSTEPPLVAHVYSAAPHYVRSLLLQRSTKARLGYESAKRLCLMATTYTSKPHNATVSFSPVAPACPGRAFLPAFSAEPGTTYARIVESERPREGNMRSKLLWRVCGMTVLSIIGVAFIGHSVRPALAQVKSQDSDMQLQCE